MNHNIGAPCELGRQAFHGHFCDRTTICEWCMVKMWMYEWTIKRRVFKINWTMCTWNMLPILSLTINIMSTQKFVLVVNKVFISHWTNGYKQDMELAII
jgi:hypothetical protein